MTDVQKILLAMSTGYHDGQIGEEDCEGIAKALNGVPEAYHMDALKSFLGIQEDQPEEQPEDYLAVKTYTSSEFHVGDEVKSIYPGERAIILKNSEGGNNSRFYAVFPDGSSGVKEKGDLTRTGRNFLAITAILEELKKG